MAEPKLRFKDEQGREYPEWKRQKLGNIFVQTNNYSTLDDKKELYSLTVENGITPKTERYDRSFLVKKNDKFKIVHKNEFVYNPMNMTIGAVGYNNLRKDIIVSGYYVVMKSNNVSTNEYWYNWLKSPKTIRLFKQKATGSLIEKQRIQFSTFEKIKADIPSLPEQQKIADFLTTVDRQIDIQSQRVEAMKTRKKGLLQKIFSQEIRFKDDEGREFPEWEEKTIVDLLKNNKGAMKIGPFGSALKKSCFQKFGKKVYAQENVFENNFSIGKDYISEELFEKLKSCRLEAGDIVLSMMGTIGNCSIFPKNAEEGIMNSHLLRLQLKNTVSNVFIVHQFSSMWIQKQIGQLSVGGIMNGLSSTVVKKLLFKLPSLPEQQKIADFLTAVDKQIEVEEKRLETMKTIKKGLLQQMFI